MIAPIAQQSLKPYTYKILFCVLGVVMTAWEFLDDDWAIQKQTNVVNNSTTTSTTTSTATNTLNNNNIVYTLPSSGIPDPIPTQRVMGAFPTTDDGAPQHLFKDCPITSQIKIYRSDLLPLSSSDSELSATTSNASSSSTETSSIWNLQTLDINGNIKTVGGDDIYVTYTADGQAEPTAIATVIDLNNGNYTLQFVTSPTLQQQLATAASVAANQSSHHDMQQTFGQVEVWLEQSCGIGGLAPPLKNSWRTSGAINQRYVVGGKIPAPNYIAPFVPPNSDGNINFANFDQIALLGASLVGQFACAENDKPSLSRCETFKPNLYKGQLIQAALNSQTLQRHWKIPAQMMIQQAKTIARTTKSQKSGRIVGESEPLRIGIVVGSGVWDILADDSLQGGVDFKDHIQACRELITYIRGTFPDVTIYWKSMTAMHIHQTTVVPNWWTIKRLYYMSNSRSRRLYEVQTNLMKELNVTVLDVYHATALSAAHTRHGDGRHYQPDFNRMTLDWFYPQS